MRRKSDNGFLLPCGVTQEFESANSGFLCALRCVVLLRQLHEIYSFPDTAPNQMGAGMLLPFEPDFDFTNFTSPIKQEDDAAFGGGAQQIAASGGAGGGGGGVLRQLMDADQPVESMDLNETALVEGTSEFSAARKL